jgi:hypothetical protein
VLAKPERGVKVKLAISVIVKNSKSTRLILWSRLLPIYLRITISNLFKDGAEIIWNKPPAIWYSQNFFVKTRKFKGNMPVGYDEQIYIKKYEGPKIWLYSDVRGVNPLWTKWFQLNFNAGIVSLRRLPKIYRKMGRDSWFSGLLKLDNFSFGVSSAIPKPGNLPLNPTLVN